MSINRLIALSLGAALLAGCQPQADGSAPVFTLDRTAAARTETGVPTQPATETLAAACPSDPAIVDAMIDAVDAARTSEGKTVLKRDDRLNRVAQSHACDMARMGKATVVGSNGSSVVDRARAENYPVCGVVQLVAPGGRPDALVTAAMTSPPHREQLLGQLSDDIGAGMAVGADGRQWWSVVLGDNCR